MVVRAIVLALLRPFVALTVEGLDQVPRTGGFLLVANHLHNADPILIQAALKRPVHFMAKEELFRVPLISTIARLAGSFPVNRQRPGRAAIRHARELLAHGIPVGMFPEGTRSKTGQLATAYPGAGAIAVASRCPIAPVAIWGTERLPGGAGSGQRRRRSSRFDYRYSVTVRFGEPFDLSPALLEAPRASAAATAEIMAAIASILPPSYHGVYGGEVANQDDLAGSSSAPRSSAR